MDLLKNTLHKESKWEFKTIIKDHIFSNFNFTKTDFNSPVFKNVTFTNSFFYKNNLNDVRTYSCHFKDCHFVSVNLSNITLGAHGGTFENCVFEKCNFKNGYFYYPEFSYCVFDKCKLKNIDFKASSFYSCKFIGKIEDCTFRKEYKTDYTLGASLNLMYKIDFSEAILGDYVAFDNCDLSTCIPPKDATFDELLEPSQFHINMQITKKLDII